MTNHSKSGLTDPCQSEVSCKVQLDQMMFRAFRVELEVEIGIEAQLLQQSTQICIYKDKLSPCLSPFPIRKQLQFEFNQGSVFTDQGEYTSIIFSD